MLVRATIAGTRYWLDGTRAGDRFLDALPPPWFRWALPLTRAGGTLETVVPAPFPRPQQIDVIDIDARAGTGAPATVTARQVMRADAAFAVRTRLAGLSHEDADRALKQYWAGQIDWVQADTVGWRYDERHAVVLLTMAGQGRAPWTGDARAGRSLEIPHAGFYPPDRRLRPKEQDQGAP